MPETFDILVAPRDFGHKPTGYAPEVFRPLVDDFRARRNDDDTIDFAAIDQLLGDRAGRDRLAGAGRRIDEEVAVFPLDEEPTQRFVERFNLPWAEFGLHFA